MNLADLGILACVACGRTPEAGPLLKLARASVWPNARVCPRCAAKYSLRDLGREADETLANATPRPIGTGRCGHCGEPSYTLWCDACERERRQLMAGV